MQTWATSSTKLFYKTEIVGLENLPAADEGAVVYVANHQSFLDVYPLYHIGRQFRYVSKAENFQLPFLGVLMQFNNYIPLDRTSTKDQVVRTNYSLHAILTRRKYSVVRFSLYCN